MIRKNEQHDGFTLLEIIIVIFLSSLVLGMATLFFAGTLPSAKLNAAGREVSAVMRYARSLARMNAEKKTVIIDLDNRVYGIEGISSKSFPPATQILYFDPVFGEKNRGKYAIAFHATGGIDGGSVVLSNDKKTIRIETDPVTGSVVIK
ncbi:MAG: prepilin-type N-terminal cleavage/methylation domain-containing protein [Syntrophaceae bacterium]